MNSIIAFRQRNTPHQPDQNPGWQVLFLRNDLMPMPGLTKPALWVVAAIWRKVESNDAMLTNKESADEASALVKG